MAIPRFIIVQLYESLDEMSKREFSSVLINPCDLSERLQQDSLQLPSGLPVLTGLIVEEMYV